MLTLVLPVSHDLSCLGRLGIIFHSDLLGFELGLAQLIESSQMLVNLFYSNPSWPCS